MPNTQTADNWPSTDPGPSTRLMDERERLIKNGSYLGGSAGVLRDQFEWIRIGRGSQLVTKESVVAATHTDNDLESAILSAIVLIDHDECWLTPPTVPKYKTDKLSFLGRASDKCFLSQDMDVVLKNANSLMESEELSLNDAERTGVIQSLKTGGRALEFRHVVFEKRQSSDDKEPSPVNETTSDTIEWSSDDWAEFKKLSSTHKVNALPAYDINGDIIVPKNYKKELAGAIARVTFTLSHWFINRKASNTFVADIDSIRVLVPPPQNSPKKRKLSQRDPYEESPTKKSRFL